LFPLTVENSSSAISTEAVWLFITKCTATVHAIRKKVAVEINSHVTSSKHAYLMTKNSRCWRQADSHQRLR
jgi:hypothetical protein